MAMPGGNPKNLRNFSSDQARINGAKGGKASQVAQKRKKNLQQLAVALLQSEGGLTDDERAELEALGIDPTQGAALLNAMQKKAKRGSERAAEFVRDTSGQAPKTQTQITIGDGMTPDDIRNLTDAELQAILANGSDDDM